MTDDAVSPREVEVVLDFVRRASAQELAELLRVVEIEAAQRLWRALPPPAPPKPLVGARRVSGAAGVSP